MNNNDYSDTSYSDPGLRDAFADEASRTWYDYKKREADLAAGVPGSDDIENYKVMVPVGLKNNGEILKAINTTQAEISSYDKDLEKLEAIARSFASKKKRYDFVGKNDEYNAEIEACKKDANIIKEKKNRALADLARLKKFDEIRRLNLRNTRSNDLNHVMKISEQLDRAYAELKVLKTKLAVGGLRSLEQMRLSALENEIIPELLEQKRYVKNDTNENVDVVPKNTRVPDIDATSNDPVMPKEDTADSSDAETGDDVSEEKDAKENDTDSVEQKDKPNDNASDSESLEPVSVKTDEDNKITSKVKSGWSKFKNFAKKYALPVGIVATGALVALALGAPLTAAILPQLPALAGLYAGVKSGSTRK